ncbi:uncharacterized protein LOC143693968 [Agelaius phoeniceus]|uniref:uncharacterized protein LOC143693968 n=1 Tax=Agelaius phoeniceus TaxID=39638 RepID=UPI004055053F
MRHPPPPEYPGTPSQPPVTACEQKPGGTDTRPVTSCPACPKRRPRPVRAASSLALADHFSLVGFFALVATWGDSHRHPRKLPHGNKKQRREVVKYLCDGRQDFQVSSAPECCYVLVKFHV